MRRTDPRPRARTCLPRPGRVYPSVAIVLQKLQPLLAIVLALSAWQLTVKAFTPEKVVVPTVPAAGK